MLKPIVQIYPVLATRDEAERIALRPVGRNREKYQEALEGWKEIVKAADEMGLWGAATIEHHFWSEGYEVGPSPGIINAYMAALTKQIRVGALGYVMSTQNPIRVAEDTAIIDHLTKGRSFVGFARGFQSRWADVLGQHYGTGATRSPTAPKFAREKVDEEARQRAVEIDNKNRAVVEENIDLVLRAWTEDSIAHNGEIWQIPFPYETGITTWPLAIHGATGRLGAPGEVDENGVIRRICVVPAPYQRPHPPVFVSGSGSPATVEFCARRGFTLVHFSNIDSTERLTKFYGDVAREAGRPIKPGQNQSLVRYIHIGKTDEEACALQLAADFDVHKNFMSQNHNTPANTPEEALAGMERTGLWSVGSIDTVRDHLVSQWRRVPAEYVTLIFHYAAMPTERVIENLHLFMRHIKPALDEVIEEAHANSLAAE
ncbi:MAG TPA: LLM class flavin-dependent oxidoreductase [Beijerinckiaceae bacterium]|nr:LLM class flavin-dependent oxidoreductase [Beijerinckiaceae bacterium]